jgi:spore coat polysaccharide biosynthesis protein SpsF
MKIGGIVHSRMTSQRHPGKPLEPIEGRAALLHIVDRMAACDYLELEDIVVCTTVDERDNPLADAMAAEGINVFRGSRLDVLDRLYSATAEFGFDAVVQVDGDDVCADTLYMNRAMELLLDDESLDLVVVKGLPLGLATKAIRFRAFQRVHDVYVPGDNSTGASYFLTRSGLCKVGEIQASPDHRHDRARITLDEAEDLAFFRAVFEQLYVPGEVFGVDDLLELLDEQPELIEINAALNDHYFDRHDEHARRERLRYRTPAGICEVDVP